LRDWHRGMWCLKFNSKTFTLDQANKKLYSDIQGELRVYTFSEGWIIESVGRLANIPALAFLGIIFLIAFALFCDEPNWTGGIVMLVTGTLSMFIFGYRKDLQLNTVSKTYQVRFFLYGKKIFHREHVFSEPLLRFYDSDVHDIYGFPQTDEGSATYQLHLMMKNGFKDVFTFSSRDTAYGLKHILQKTGSGFVIQ